MKIGILTFHSQLNYGGVLQCWALQTALEKMGHKVVVIDRWLTPDNWHLERGYNHKGRKWWLRFWPRALLGLGDIRFWLRVRRTKRFIRRNLHLTPYHFVDWKNAPCDLGVDMIVVGSDQVWRCWLSQDVRPYLLEGTPVVRAIAYAASLGMEHLPEHLGDATTEWGRLPAEPVFKAGLARFGAISCREAAGVRICNELGFAAQHVVDPVLLLSRMEWLHLAGLSRQLPSRRHRRRRKLVCYFLGENLNAALQVLNDFARKNYVTVDVLVNDQRKEDFLPAPMSPQAAKCWIKGLFRHFAHVHVRESYGPGEFVQAHAVADSVLTDSFHSLMFSIIFGKDVRVLAPASGVRRSMFSRIEEFASHMSCPIVSLNIQSALSSFTEDGPIPEIDNNWLDQRRKESLAFLCRGLHEDM